jgi:GDP-mannose 4,6-dehydratase
VDDNYAFDYKQYNSKIIPGNIMNCCRICKSTDCEDVINLGNQVITSRFPKVGDYSTPSTPICLTQCNNCKLVQLKENLNGSELYEYEYGYRSGLNNTMRDHLKRYNEYVQTYISLQENDYVLDIGSNDATFLKNYNSSINRVGIDPTGKQFANYYDNIKLIPTYFTKENIQNVLSDTKFKIITSISMFYDLPDPVQFAKDIYEVLEDNGIWSLEQSYILTMIKRKSIDTICHEHIEYYAVKQIKEIMDRAGFKIINITENECNGGSFRITVAKQSSTKFMECITLINKYLENEKLYKLSEPNTYRQFLEDCDYEVKKLKHLIKAINESGKKVYIYGASTKGNCLLQYANIGPDLVKYAVERNPQKVGKMTSTFIEIISEETMRENPPEYLLVLPWHFKDEIIKRESEFLENGGQFIFPLPNISIIGNKPKVLITGINGQIGSYVRDIFSKKYSIYGIHRSAISHNQSTNFSFDLTDKNALETTILTINPDVIVHLASLTKTEDCIQNPINACEINGVVTVQLCDIIHKNKLKTKLLNASSSEIFKGQNNYTISDKSNYFIPTHPYAFAKLLGHQFVDFYRNTYNIKAFNCIVFTTESSLRNNFFLLKKISEHAKTWKDKGEPIHVGSLDSNRSILHAYDVANAFYLIAEQDVAKNFIISNDFSFKIKDLVKLIYNICNIDVYEKNNTLIESDTKKTVVIMDCCFRNEITDIKGDNSSLKSIGWQPTYTIEDTLREMIH